MGERQPNYYQVAMSVKLREKMVIDDLRATAGLVSDADVLRLAMQHLARHYDYDLPLDLFALQQRRDPRKVSA